MEVLLVVQSREVGGLNHLAPLFTQLNLNNRTTLPTISPGLLGVWTTEVKMHSAVVVEGVCHCQLLLRR